MLEKKLDRRNRPSRGTKISGSDNEVDTTRNAAPISGDPAVLASNASVARSSSIELMAALKLLRIDTR
jgi:hypothetical protein